MTKLALVIITFVLFSADSGVQQTINQLKIPAERTPPHPFTHPRWGELRDFVLLIAGSISIAFELLLLFLAGIVYQNSQRNPLLGWIAVILTIASVVYLVGVSSWHFIKILATYLINRHQWQFLRKIKAFQDKPEKEIEVLTNKSVKGFILLFVLTEIALSFDNLIAALNITNDPVSLIIGLVIGAVIVFFCIKQLGFLLERFPTAQHAGQIILFLLGVATALSAFNVEIPQLIEEGAIIVILAASILIDIVKRKKDPDSEEQIYDLIPQGNDNIIKDGSFVVPPGSKEALLTLRLNKGTFPAGKPNTILCLPENRSASKLYVAKCQIIVDIIQFVNNKWRVRLPIPKWAKNVAAIIHFANTVKDDGLLNETRQISDADKKVDIVGYTAGSDGKQSHLIGTYGRGESVSVNLEQIQWGGKARLLPGVIAAIKLATRPDVDFVFLVVLVTGQIQDMKQVLRWTRMKARLMSLGKCTPVKIILVGTYKANEKQGKLLDDADVTHTKRYGIDIWDFKFLKELSNIEEFIKDLQKEGLFLLETIIGSGTIYANGKAITERNKPLKETMRFKVPVDTTTITIIEENGKEHKAEIQKVVA